MAIEVIDLKNEDVSSELLLKLRGDGWEKVYNYGHSKDNLRKPIVAANVRNDIRYLGFDDKSGEILAAMEKITEIANTGDVESRKDRQAYRNQLEKVYKKMAEKLKEKIGDRKGLIFPPKNGGIFVKEVYEKMGFENFYDYQMSRQHGENGELMVAVKEEKNNPKMEDFEVYVIADDCIASDVSADATLRKIKRYLEEREILIKDKEIIITVSAASVRGVESLIESNSELGYGKIEVIAATPVYEMSDNFYLIERRGDQVLQVVGDMGNWSKP